MEFSSETEIFSSLVGLVSRIVNPKSNLPLLNNILLDVQKKKLVVTGTDLDVQISASIELEPKDLGKTSVNARLFSQYINTITKDETVEVSLNKNVLNVKSTSGSAQFTTREADDFPLFSDTELETVFEIPANVITDMIDRTIFASAKDDIRPILTGILFEVEGNTVNAVALDTFRLSKVTATVTNQILTKQQFVVSHIALDNVARIIRDPFVSTLSEKDIVTVKLSKSGNFCLIEYNGVKVYSRLLEGDYPAYKQVIPAAHQTEVIAKRELWLEALKRVSVFAQSAIGQKVILEFKEGTISMKAEVPEIGAIEQSLEANIQGEAMKIAFQNRFLLDILNILKSSDVTFKATNKSSPGVFIDSENESFLHILMPLKLED